MQEERSSTILLEANRHFDANWMVRDYGAPGYQMVIHAWIKGQYQPIRFCTPYYVRLPLRFRHALFSYSARQATCNRQNSSETSTGDLVVSIRAEGGDYCIVCDKIDTDSFSDVYLLPPYKDQILVGTGKVAELTEYLQAFCGAKMQLVKLSVSHGKTIFLLTGLTQGSCAIEITATNFVDVLTTMHDVALRVAAHSDLEILRAYLPENIETLPKSTSNEHLQFIKENVMVIECEEGAYYVWAGIMRIYSVIL